jgi:hypothetical protein
MSRAVRRASLGRRVLLALAASGLLCGGCGSARQDTRPVQRTATAAAAPQGKAYVGATASEEELAPDDDGDNDGGASFDDKDHRDAEAAGRAARPGERAAVVAAVRRYYVAAATGAATRGCALLYPTLAHSAAEDYGREQSPFYLHGGKSCTDILARLFAHFHHRLSLLQSRLTVGAVRIKGDEAFVFMHFAGLPSRQIALHRLGRAWRLSALIDSPLA